MTGIAQFPGGSFGKINKAGITVVQAVVYFDNHSFLIAQVGHPDPCTQGQGIVRTGHLGLGEYLPVGRAPAFEFIGVKTGCPILNLGRFGETGIGPGLRRQGGDDQQEGHQETGLF
jgi:hypothetical protein